METELSVVLSSACHLLCVHNNTTIGKFYFIEKKKKKLKKAQMSSDIKIECLINGVRYDCRTCFDPGRTFYSLKDEYSKSKTWCDLLMDVTQIQVIEIHSMCMYLFFM